MPNETNLEQRLAVLEKEVAELKHSVRPGPNWFERVSGSMKNEPDFDEVLRLGREIRQADRPSEASPQEP